MRIDNQKGVISLEATIALSMFMCLMLLIYSFFLVFETQYTIEHAMIQAGKSISMENYAAEKIMKSGDGSLGGYLTKSGTIGAIVTELYVSGSDAKSDYSEYSKLDAENTDEIVARVKKRVLCYLGEDKQAVESYLKKLRVENGIAGLDFSDTVVSAGNLIIKVRYSNKLMFDFPSMKIGTIDMNLTVKSALWR